MLARTARRAHAAREPEPPRSPCWARAGTSSTRLSRTAAPATRRTCTCTWLSRAVLLRIRAGCCAAVARLGNVSRRLDHYVLCASRSLILCWLEDGLQPSPPDRPSICDVLTLGSLSSVYEIKQANGNSWSRVCRYKYISGGSGHIVTHRFIRSPCDRTPSCYLA
jgi:hypothetical protein